MCVAFPVIPQDQTFTLVLKYWLNFEDTFVRKNQLTYQFY